MDRKLREARAAKIQILTKQLKKDKESASRGNKRGLSDLTQTKLQLNGLKSRKSSHSNTRGTTTQEETESASQSVRCEEEEKQRPRIDIDKVITERKEQKFFEKEWNKDMRKINEKKKLEEQMKALQEVNPDHPDIEKLTKKIKGENKKADIYDQYADGEIDVFEFENKVR